MIVAMGDTHLHPNAWASMPKVCGDTHSAFDQIVTYAIEHRARCVVLPGDIFDTHPPAETVAFFLMQVERLRDAMINVYTIQGQHGRTRTTPWPNIHPWVKALDNHDGQQGVLCGATAVLGGLDNCGPEELRHELALFADDHKDVNILFLHQMCRGLVPDMDGAWDLDPDWVPHTIKLVVMGDLHKPIELQHHGTRFVYTGSGAMMSIDETPDKSFLVIDENNFTYQRVPLKTRPFKKFELRPNKDAAALQATVDNALAEAATLAPETLCVVNFDPHLPNIEEAFKSKAPGVHFMFRPIALEAAGVEIRDIEASSVSLVGCLDKVVDREKDGWLHSFMLQLLPSRDPKGTVLEARKGVISG